TLEQRERALARRSADLAMQEQRQREEAERIGQLETRVDALDERERTLAHRSAELKVLEHKLEQERADAERRARDLSDREAELAAPPPPPPPREPEPAPPVAAGES